MSPKVSVIVITYNQEKFIEAALKGILLQKTNFDFEIVIAEDKSTDNTRLICETYHAKYSNLINLLPSKINHGMMPNFMRAFNSCKSELIAICEGDDYWIDPNKLQRQVDFLEKNCEYVLITENAYILDSDKFSNFTGKETTKSFDQKALISSNQCITCTVLFKRCFIKIPSFFSEFKIGDYPLYILLLNYGNGYHSNHISSVYRLHPGGVYSSLSRSTQILNEIFVFDTLYNNNSTKYKSLVKIKIQLLYYDLLRNHSEYRNLTTLKSILNNFTFHEARSYLISLKAIIIYIL